MAVCGTCLELTSESGSEVLPILHHQFWQCYCKVCLVHVVCMSQSLQWYSWAGSLSIFNKVSAKAKAAPILKLSSKQKRCAQATAAGVLTCKKNVDKVGRNHASLLQTRHKQMWLKMTQAASCIMTQAAPFFPSAQAPIPAQTEGPVANGGPSRKLRGIAERLSCKQTDKDWRVPRKPAIPRSFAVERVLAADVSNDIAKPSDSPPLFIQWYPILINDIDLRNWSEAHRGAFQANAGFLQANEPQSFFSGSAAPICCRMNLSWRTKHNCTNFFRMMSGQPSCGMPWIC